MIELHGSLWRARCTSCLERLSGLPPELPKVPNCSSYGRLLRPDIVWFNESLDPELLRASAEEVDHCDLFLVIGTSAQVYPAASFAFAAARRGVPVIEINPERTPFSESATIVLQGPAGKLLPRVLEASLRSRAT